MRLFQKPSPIEEYKISTDLAQAESIQRAMGPVLGKELISLISQISTMKPDLGMYSYLSGQIFIINKILNSVRMTKESAMESAHKARRDGF